MDDKSFLKLMLPDTVSNMIHGDLHFENILVNPQTMDFKLIDPRGYKYCDIWYDFGKLSHSANSKYDFIHESMFSLKYKLIRHTFIVDLVFHDSNKIKIFDEINIGLDGLYWKYSMDMNYKIKVIFNEAMHFSADMPFHLAYDNREEKAIAIYVTGVKLINDFLKLYQSL